MCVCVCLFVRSYIVNQLDQIFKPAIFLNGHLELNLGCPLFSAVAAKKRVTICIVNHQNQSV